MSYSGNTAVSEPVKFAEPDSHIDLNPVEQVQNPISTPTEHFQEKANDDIRETSAIVDKADENNEIKEVNIEIEKEDNEDKEVENKKDSENPLLDEESITIDIVKPNHDDEDTPTLPLRDKNKISKKDSETLDEKQKGRLPVHLFPFSRIKKAWNESSNISTFLSRTVCIIFQTIGWFTCVGGIPFLSLVMLIIGSIYINDCNIEPKIPVYLIVTGVIGTIQHFITIWTKYVPRESQGRLKVYRSYCNSINGLFHMFLIIWFILGCVWVYGAYSEVKFNPQEKLEYCHKTLYHFAFWILNLSFILIGMIIMLTVCFLICVIVTPKEKD